MKKGFLKPQKLSKRLILLLILSFAIYTLFNLFVFNHYTASETSLELLDHLDLSRESILAGNPLKIAKALGFKIRWHREYSEIYKTLSNNLSSIENRLKSHIFKTLDSQLYGDWLNTKNFETTLDFQHREKSESGIVLSCGSKQVPLALTLLHSLRNIWKSKLKVEVFYWGKWDLNKGNQSLFEHIENVKLVDLKMLVNDGVRLKGFGIKAFSMVFSSFKKTMLIDADTRSPDYFFKNEIFKNHGMLFYYDRTLGAQNAQVQPFLKSLLQTPIPNFISTTQHYKQKLSHKMESGLVMLDTDKHFNAILVIALLNGPTFSSNLLERLSYGEKESFWIAMAILGIEPRFSPYKVASIGKIKDGDRVETKKKKKTFLDSKTTQICGRHIVHLCDDSGEPCWLNGGLFVEKLKPKTSLMEDFEFVGFEGPKTRYNFTGPSGFSCTGNFSVIKPVSREMKNVFYQGWDIWVNIRNRFYKN